MENKLKYLINYKSKHWQDHTRKIITSNNFKTQDFDHISLMSYVPRLNKELQRNLKPLSIALNC